MSARNSIEDNSDEEKKGTDESPKLPTGLNDITDYGKSEKDGNDNETSGRMSDDENNVNNRAFFIEKHSDVHSHDEDSENVLLENDDVESISEHYDDNSVHSNEDVCERNCSGFKVPTLWEIVSRLLERRYAGDIVRVKALYAQVIAYYRAKYPHEDKAKKSEVSDIAMKWPAGQKTGGDTDDTKSDTSEELMGTDTDGDKSENEEVIVEDSLDTCKDGSEKVIIGTISEVHRKNDTESSETGSGSDSSTSDSESESSGSQPDDENIVPAVGIKEEKLECVGELPASIVVKQHTL